MELDASMFDSELFSVDLENISIPSLPLQFQFPDTDLADEAELSDMGAVGLSVIDPHFVRENRLEECVAEVVGQVGSSTPSCLSDCLSSFDVAKHYSRLHILVCGYCHAVFHVIDEFRSHTTCCLGACEPVWSSLATPGLALVLWTDTVLRLVRQRLGGVSDPENIVRKIESKWFRLSRRTKQGWEKAADVLLETARVGRSLFSSAMERDISRTSPCPGEQWPGPLDFCEGGADEIHGTEWRETVKLEADAGAELGLLASGGQAKQEGGGGDVQTQGVKRDIEACEDSSISSKSARRPGYLNTIRNKRGRWEAPKVERKVFKCESCNFVTATEWKLKRHEQSSKHQEMIGSGPVNQVPADREDRLGEEDDPEGQTAGTEEEGRDCRTFAESSTDHSPSCPTSDNCISKESAILNS